MSVGHGALVTFAFSVLAPNVPGTYPMQWQMLQEDVEWFGEVAEFTFTVR